jgi:hypothetical protein
MIGAATALSQFCRSIGATIGAAVMGAILHMRYMESLRGAMVSKAVPEEIAAVLANPARMIEIKMILAKAYGQSPDGLATAGYLIEQIKSSLVFALHGVFLLGAIIAFIGLVTNFFVVEKKLRGR